MSNRYILFVIDPALDYKEYKSTQALIDAKPMPEVVRVVDAMCSPDTMANQDPGDVIIIRRVEEENHPERGNERVRI